MKPVIKKQVYYSMLLMRDDTSVKTLRVRGGAITFFLFFLLLIILAGAGGIWGGLHYWKKYAQLSERQQVQERELAEARLQLERYVNYDTLLEAANGSSAPRAKNEEIGAAAAAARTQNATQAALVPAQNSTRPDAAVVQAKAATNATLPQHNATALVPATALADQGASKNSSMPLISSGSSPLRINGFIGRVVGPQRVRVRYELSTVPSDEQRTIAGTAKYIAVFADGAEVEIPVQEVSDARFAISRMKLMEASLRLPQGLAAKDINQLHVSLELEEGKTYRETYPVTR